ncbi:MAG: hypothetical protein AVDCRST_MAG13-236, partial [uncultured Solirubrobacteraceae bacterium]
ARRGRRDHRIGHRPAPRRGRRRRGAGRALRPQHAGLGLQRRKPPRPAPARAVPRARGAVGARLRPRHRVPGRRHRPVARAARPPGHRPRGLRDGRRPRRPHGGATARRAAQGAPRARAGAGRRAPVPGGPAPRRAVHLRGHGRRGTVRDGGEGEPAHRGARVRARSRSPRRPAHPQDGGDRPRARRERVPGHDIRRPAGRAARRELRRRRRRPGDRHARRRAPDRRPRDPGLRHRAGGAARRAPRLLRRGEADAQAGHGRLAAHRGRLARRAPRPGARADRVRRVSARQPARGAVRRSGGRAGAGAAHMGGMGQRHRRLAAGHRGDRLRPGPVRRRLPLHGVHRSALARTSPGGPRAGTARAARPVGLRSRPVL